MTHSFLHVNVKVEAIVGKNDEAIMNFEKVIKYSYGNGTIKVHTCVHTLTHPDMCIHPYMNSCKSHSLWLVSFTGSINWSICCDIYGWVCNASKDKVWLFKAKQISAWFVDHWFYKARSFCGLICALGKKRWERSFILYWEGQFVK